jgi:hypothetical protein
MAPADDEALETPTPDDDVDAVDDMHGNTPNRWTQPRGGTVGRLGASIRRTG